jgi:hypothetical protein
MKPKRRSHRNTPRVTARERAERVIRGFFSDDVDDVGAAGIQREIQDHARAALARAKRRRDAAGGTRWVFDFGKQNTAKHRLDWKSGL